MQRGGERESSVGKKADERENSFCRGREEIRGKTEQKTIEGKGGTAVKSENFEGGKGELPK